MKKFAAAAIAISLLLVTPRRADAHGGVAPVIFISGLSLAPGKLVFLGFDIVYAARRERPPTAYSVMQLVANLPQAVAGWLFAFAVFSNPIDVEESQMSALFAIAPTVLVLHSVIALAWPEAQPPGQWTLAPLLLRGEGGGLAVFGRF